MDKKGKLDKNFKNILDKKANNFLKNGLIVCKKKGAYFRPNT